MFHIAITAPAALLAAALIGPPASAAEQVDGTDPAVIENIASGYGSASLEKDDHGDPMIEGRMEGLLYYVFFYGCESNKNCNSIQFSVSFEDTGFDAVKVNEWNAGKRFGTAFLDGTGSDVTLHYDVNLAYGVSRRNLDDTFDYWRTVLIEFEEFLGW